MRTMMGASDKAKEMVANANGNTVALENLTRSSKAAAIGMKALSTAGNMLLGMAISFGISKLIEGLDYLINYKEKQKEAFENAKAATEEAAKSIRDLKSEMSDTSSKAKNLSSEFANLVQGVNPFTNENKSLSTEQYEKFLDVNNQLAELFPSLTHNYDENGNAILGLSGDVDTVTASIQRLVEQQNNLAKADMRKYLDDYVNGTEDNEGVFTALEGSKKEVADAEKDLKELKATYNSIIKGTGKKTFSVRDNDYNNFLENVKNGLGTEASDAIREIAVVPTGRNTNAGIKIDFSQLALDEETKGKITESYNTFYQDLQTNLSVKQSELESKNQEMSNQMMVWVEDLDLYKNSDNEAFQRAIESMVGYIQWSDLDVEEGNIEEAKQLIQSLVITPLSSACSDPDKKLQVTNAINSLFSIDFSKLSYKEASEKIKGFIEVLMNAVNAHLPEGQKKKEEDLYSMFGLTEYQGSAERMKKNLSSIAKEGSSDYQKLEDYTSRFTQKQSEAWLSATNGAKSADEAIRNYENSLKSAGESKPKSFDSVWDAIGTTGDDDAKKKALEAKDKLLELAEAGKLTVDAFKDSDIADQFMKDTGLSAEQATQKINKLVENVKQLNAMRTGITSITSAYDEKKDSKKKTVSASTLDSMGDTLGVSEWSEKDLEVWENYKSVAADGTKSTKELKEAQDRLASSYVNSNNFLANLTSANADYYESLLKEMGVTNAHEIITNKINKQQKNLSVVKKELGVASDDLKNASVSEVAALYDVDTASEEASKAMYDLMTSKIAAGDVTISTSDDCNNLLKMAEAAGIATNKLRALLNAQIEFDLSDRQTTDANSLQDAINSTSGNGKVSYVNSNGTKRTYSSKTSAMSALSHLRKNAKGNKTKAQKNVNAWTKKHKDDDVKVSLSKGNRSNDNSKKSGKGKGSSKDSKQTFDWMERRLKNLQNVIDFTASKLQNLFSVKAKNSNLNKQIKTTTKLINEYGIAAKKYQQKADQVAAGSTKTVKGKNGKKKKVKTKALSKGIIQKIQTGKLTKKTKLSSLITEYGQSTAEKIQSYIDYYDKAQDAKKNQQDQIAKKRELKQQKYQNYTDLYDSRTARAEAKEAIQVKAADKNKAVDTQLKNTRLSYQYQIKIANLTKNKAEAEKLQYELEKKVAQLKLQQIQNLQDEYDKRVGRIDNDAQDIDNAIALVQARGQTLSARYYQNLNEIQTTKRQEAVTEKSKVEAELAAALKDGSIKEGSDEWYEVQSTLHGLDNTISECDTSIAENTTAIRELHTTMLEEMAENASRMNTEADFLANLLSRKDLTDSDTGTFTNAGLGTLGTYGINMETSQAQMRELEKERAILEEMKRTGSLDYGDNGKHKYDSVNQLEEAYNNILDKQQEWTQNEYDAEQKILDLMKEYYQAQLDYMKEIIDAKKTALDYEKDLYDYQKSIAEKTKSFATLEKQAAALKGDNSEEGRARLAKIQLSLDEANQDLQDTEYERYISDQQNMLDNMYSEYEDLMNHLFKDTDKLLQEGIQVINNNGTLIKSILDKTAEDYSYNYSDRFSKITDAFTASDNIVIGIKESINGKEDSSISKRLETINHTIETKYAAPSSGSGSGSSGSDGGSTGNPSGTNGGTTQQTQTKNGQTGVSPDAMDKIEGTNEKLKNLRNALNSMKGAGFEKYWTLKSGTPKSYINQRIAAEPNYDKVYPDGKRKSQILTEKGLKLLAKKLGVKYPSSGSTKTADLNKYVKDAHFQTGGIVRANGVPLKGDNIPIRVNPNETVLTQDFTDVLPKAVDAMDQFVKEMNLEPYSPPNATLAKLASLAPDYNLMPDVKPLMPKLESVTSNNASKETFGNQTFGDINVCLELPNVSDYKTFREEMRKDNNSRHVFEVMVDDCLHKRGVTKRIKL